MKHFIAFVAAMLLAGTLGAEETEYYTWVDENGITNYSQRNPQGVNATYVGPNARAQEASRRPGGSRPGSVNASDSGEESSDEDDVPAIDSQAEEDIEAQRAAIDARIAATKRQNCEIGKRNLAQLRAFARVRVTGPDGQPRVLSEEEKQARIREAQQTISDNCESG